jgi:protein-S-isoprenylcysteine O-methyltransferase Ste14
MYIGKTRSPISVILLSIFTCGIYALYWAYSTADDVNKITGQERINPILFLVSFLIPFLPLYFAHQIDQNFIEIGQKEGIQYDSKFILWLVLLLVGIGYLVFYYQTQEMLNKVWAARGGRAA